MRNVVQLCLTADNILLLAIALAWKWQFPEDIYKKSQLGDWMITVVEFGYRKISGFVIVSQINYLPQPI